MSTEKNDSDKYFGYFIKTSIVIIIVSIIYPFIVNYFLNDWTKSGTFGDTFGALNAIFSGIAISGLIITILIQKKELENQRNELSLQRTEMIETREEFLINRITNIIYNQLERFEKAIHSFKIEWEEKTYTGYEAFFFLDSSKQTIYNLPDDKRTDEEKLIERKKLNCAAMKLYSKNSISIAQFSLQAYNSASVVKETLSRSELSIEEINNLKNLYFRNIGFINIEVLQDITDKFREYLDLTTEHYDFLTSCNLNYGKLTTATIFLNSLLKFRTLVFTKENLKEIRDNWMNEFGKHA